VDGVAPVDWASATAVALQRAALQDAPATEPATFGTPPAPATRAKSYPVWRRELVSWLQASQSVTLLRSAQLKLVSRADEDEAAFRLRLAQVGREQRDAAVAKLRARYTPKAATLEERIRRAQATAEREREQARGSELEAAISLGATVLGSFLGRKRGSATAAARGAGRSRAQRADVDRAEETVEALRARLAGLEAEFQTEAAAVQRRLDPATEELEPVVVRPRKTDVDVRVVALAFAPYWQDAAGGTVPAWA
jgi:hypothetical protein